MICILGNGWEYSAHEVHFVDVTGYPTEDVLELAKAMDMKVVLMAEPIDLAKFVVSKLSTSGWSGPPKPGPCTDEDTIVSLTRETIRKLEREVAAITETGLDRRNR